jgi:CheY-like chemotaxis protein
MNGFELADRLERTRPGMRVLFTSGDAERAVAEHGGLPPNTACLQKPFSANALARKVREILDQRRGWGCVLVVNGEALFRTLLGQILSHAGYEVLEARNGKEAIAAMRRRVPDVAIVDLAMPGRDRLETIRGIGAEFPRVPLIAISASRANPKRTSVLLRVRETLAKPVAPGDVLRAVQDALQAEKTSQGGPENRPYTENPRGTGNPRRSSPLSGL